MSMDDIDIDDIDEDDIEDYDEDDEDSSNDEDNGSSLLDKLKNLSKKMMIIIGAGIFILIGAIIGLFLLFSGSDSNDNSQSSNEKAIYTQSEMDKAYQDARSDAERKAKDEQTKADNNVNSLNSQLREVTRERDNANKKSISLQATIDKKNDEIEKLDKTITKLEDQLREAKKKN